MRIVLDLQGAQGNNRSRGIGRITLDLAKACIRNRNKHEIIIVLNSLFPETIDVIRFEFSKLLQNENIRVWSAPGPVDMFDQNNEMRRKEAELLREAFLLSLKPDIIWICSLFEHSESVTSIGCFQKVVPVAVTLYDLIPYLYPESYLMDPIVEFWYESKLGHLRRADLQLAISESSRQEGIELGLPADKIINISLASTSFFRPLDISLKNEKKLRAKYKLHLPFIMYTGGDDHRKNIAGLVRAYAGLSKDMRDKHQLAIVCSLHSNSQELLEKIAVQHGLTLDQIIFTNYIPEADLLMLYNLCKLFVFPSWHEGFGLPALEAMQCGAAVIGSNTSSLPEVIGLDEALFDPCSDYSITSKITQVLTDELFRKKLIEHGLKQAKNFSWDISARKTIAAFEKIHVEQKKIIPPIFQSINHRPKLAYVSPLPPTNSGIASYSAELLPELSRYYDIELIVCQPQIPTAPWVKANCTIRDVGWLREHANHIERIIYHFGNNLDFHSYMLDLLYEIPGVVVLHDFFLSGMYLGQGNEMFLMELYRSHGYAACIEFSKSSYGDKYPANLTVLQRAQGVIIHSNHIKKLAIDWYGANFSRDWHLIPHLRKPIYKFNRIKSREKLGLSSTDFVVCSFGCITPNKLNYQLLQAWFASSLTEDKQCKLIFIGKPLDETYYKKLLEALNSASNKCIHITGWVDSSVYHKYLAAADIAVQLRIDSRGETSGAVYDCMNYGIPTIVNQHGSLTELPRDAVWMLPDQFTIDHLQKALEDLWKDKYLRTNLGRKASQKIHEYHAPYECAKHYMEAIELIQASIQTDKEYLIKVLSKLDGSVNDNEGCAELSKAIANNFPEKKPFRQLLIDISELVQRDAKTGIQRITRSILKELLENPPSGYRVEPVYATPDRQGYYYARNFTLSFFSLPTIDITDTKIEVQSGDIFLGLDLQHSMVAQESYLNGLRRIGLQVYFVIYDLLPVLMPHAFLPSAENDHFAWLQTLSKFDGAICISQAVADELIEWLQITRCNRLFPFKIGAFHLGADIKNSVPTTGIPEKSEKIFKKLILRPTFLLVSTVEPRKGHLQTLVAFELLWQKGIQINLVFVGKKGWMVEDLTNRLRNHPEQDRRFFWLEGASDEYLQKIYETSTCLIAASEGEGFGLPLIEAAQYKLPLIVRNIPVFREIAKEYATYFSGRSPADLADVVENWLVIFKKNKHLNTNEMPWLNWRQSVQQLLNVILNDNWCFRWKMEKKFCD